MIVVVADTSPLNYLIQIDCDLILHALYDRVFVPTAVVEELGHPRAVGVVRAWLTQPPPQLAVEDVVVCFSWMSDSPCASHASKGSH